MSVTRARELTEVWRAGALRSEEERELQALLLDGGVLEAAEAPADRQAWDEALRAEDAEDWEERLDGLDRGDCYRFGYHDGAVRKHREARRG